MADNDPSLADKLDNKDEISDEDFASLKLAGPKSAYSPGYLKGGLALQQAAKNAGGSDGIPALPIYSGYHTDRYNKQPDPSQYTHSGDASQMGPPTKPADKPIEGFAPTPSGQQENAGPPATDASMSDDGSNLKDKIKRGILSVESSGGDYTAFNADGGKGGAVGAYQFRPGIWNEPFKKNLGYTVDDMKINVDSNGKPTDPPDVVARKKQMQDKAFDWYYQNQMVPGVKSLREDYPAQTKDLSDSDLAALFHFRGEKGAGKVLDGSDTSSLGGSTAEDYLKEFRLAANKGGASGVNDQVKLGQGGVQKTQIGNDDTQTGGGKDYDKEYVHNGFKDLDPAEQKVALDLKQRIAAGDTSDDKFTAELQKLKGDYQATKDRLAKAELWSVLGEALTKIGAGAFGSKYHIDTSQVHAPQHDFSKDQELAHQDFAANLGDLKARREEDIRKRESAADMAQKQSDFGLRKTQLSSQVDESNARLNLENKRNDIQESTRKDQLDYYKTIHEEQLGEKDQARQDRKAEAWQKLKDSRIDQASKILSSNMKDEDKASSVVLALSPLFPDKAGQEALHKAVYSRDGFMNKLSQATGIGAPESVRSIADINSLVSPIVDRYGKPPGEENVAYDPDGKAIMFPTHADAAQAQREFNKLKQMKGG